MTGCTSFLIQMMTTPDAKLVNACPDKLAAKYLPKHSWGPEWVKMSLKHWRYRT